MERGAGESLPEQRDGLLVQIDELEGTLRFMGKDHPKRAQTEAQLMQCRLFLSQIEAALKKA